VILFGNFTKHQLIHRCPNTERSMRYNPYDKQRDERFPEHESEYACDDKRNYDCRRDIHHGDIEYSVGMRAFSRAPENIFIITQVNT